MEFKSLHLYREKLVVDGGDGGLGLLLRSNRLVVDRPQGKFVVRTKYLYDSLRAVRVMSQCVRRRPGLWSPDCMECWVEGYRRESLPRINEVEPNWMAVYRGGNCAHSSVELPHFNGIEAIAAGQPINRDILLRYAREAGSKSDHIKVDYESIPFLIAERLQHSIKAWYLLRLEDIESRSFVMLLGPDRRRWSGDHYAVIYVAEKLFELNALAEEHRVMRRKYGDGDIAYIKSRSVHDLSMKELQEKKEDFYRFARNARVEFIPDRPSFDFD